MQKKYKGLTELINCEEAANKYYQSLPSYVKEQIDTCPAKREDLKAEYQFRYDVIQEYAPSLMSEEEIRNFIMEKFADIVAQKNKGMIMKNVMPELKGKADGKLINQVVAKLCES